jgi:archaellum component FlaC
VAINAEASIAKIEDEFDEFGRVVEQMGKDLDGAKQEIEQGADYAEGTRNDLVLHRNDKDENAQHLTAIEKENLQDRLTDIDSIIEDIERIDGDIDNVKGDAFQEGERLNRLTDEVYGLEDRVSVLEAIPKTEVPTTLEVNTAYNFGKCTELSLSFPELADDGDVIHIMFHCYETPTNLIINTGNTTDIDLVPEENMGYEIYAKYDGATLYWIVKYSEHEVW